jgi:hypothetical protein
MRDFSKVKFKWTFRDYQQAVLDNSQKHLKDKRIHIVAAPGSGKTILGLELVRRQNAPALVMSPSVTIRSGACSAISVIARSYSLRGERPSVSSSETIVVSSASRPYLPSSDSFAKILVFSVHRIGRPSFIGEANRMLSIFMSPLFHLHESRREYVLSSAASRPNTVSPIQTVLPHQQAEIHPKCTAPRPSRRF